MEIYPKPPSIAQLLPSDPEPSLSDQIGNLLDSSIYVENYKIIVPETDDTLRVNRAIADLGTTKSKLIFAGKTYNISSTLNIPSNTDVLLSPLTAINANNCTAFGAKSSIQAYTTNPLLTVGILPGDLSITVDQTTNVSVGDIIWMDNGGTLANITTQPNTEDDVASQVEFFHVITKTATTITLNRAANFSFPVNQPVNNFARAENITIQGGKIVCNSNNRAISIQNVYNMNVDNVIVDGGGQSQGIIYDYHVYHGSIKNCTVKNTSASSAIELKYHCSDITIAYNHLDSHDLNIIGDGYIVLYNGINNCTVIGNRIHGYNRSGIYGIAIHTKSYSNTVTGNIVRGCGYGIGSAYGSFANTINGNTINSCQSGIALIDSREFTVNGNTIKNCGTSTDNTTAGIYSKGGYDHAIEGNTITEGRQRAIYLTQGNYRVVVKGNTITKHGNGIETDGGLTDCDLSHNTMYKCTSGIAGFGTIDQSDIIANKLISSTSHGLWLDTGGQNNTVEANKVSGSGGDGIRMRNNFSLSYVRFNRCMNNTGYGINASDAGSAINHIADNTCTGNTAGRSSGLSTSAPTSTIVGDANFMIFNEPADPTLAKTVLGWRRKDATTGGATGYRTVNVSET